MFHILSSFYFFKSHSIITVTCYRTELDHEYNSVYETELRILQLLFRIDSNQKSRKSVVPSRYGV